MEDETKVIETPASPRSALPRATAFGPETSNAAPATAQHLTTYTGSAASADDKGRNGVFAHLVQGDDDIAGLVAYSIYKQHKLDWLRAFEAVQGRPPNESELASYFIGEGTPRRISTYRHLAEATLSGHGPNGGGVAIEPGRARSSTLRERNKTAPTLIVVYALIAVLFVIGLWLAFHFTVTSR